MVNVKASGPPNVLKIVVDVKASGPPNVLKIVDDVKASVPPNVLKIVDDVSKSILCKNISEKSVYGNQIVLTYCDSQLRPIQPLLSGMDLPH